MNLGEDALGTLPLGSLLDETPPPITPISPWAVLLCGMTVDDTGVLIPFPAIASEVVLILRDVSSAGAVCYVAPNLLPTAVVNGGGVGLQNLSSMTYQGRILAIGAIMDSGTAVLELVIYRTLTVGRISRTGPQR